MMTTLLIAANSTQLDPGFFQEVKKRKEKNVKEIAAILEMPSGSVRAYLSRGRQHVKNILEKWKTR